MQQKKNTEAHTNLNDEIQFAHTAHLYFTTTQWRVLRHLELCPTVHMSLLYIGVSGLASRDSRAAQQHNSTIEWQIFKSQEQKKKVSQLS